MADWETASVVRVRGAGPMRWGQVLYRLERDDGAGLGVVTAVRPDPVRHAWVLDLRDADGRVLAEIVRPLTGLAQGRDWRVLDPGGAELAELRPRYRLLRRPRHLTRVRRGRDDLARIAFGASSDPWSLLDVAGRELATVSAPAGGGPDGPARRTELPAAGADARRLALACVLTQLIADAGFTPPAATGPASHSGAETAWTVAAGDGPGSPGVLGILGEVLRIFR